MEERKRSSFMAVVLNWQCNRGNANLREYMKSGFWREGGYHRGNERVRDNQCDLIGENEREKKKIKKSKKMALVWTYLSFHPFRI